MVRTWANFFHVNPCGIRKSKDPASHVVVSLRETEVSIVMWVPQNVDGLENMETPHWDDIWG